MRFLKYVVGLGIAAIAILGCATESGTPTATPLPASTPEPPSDTSAASAQEIVVDLCSQPVEVRSFDTTTRTISFEDDVLVDAGTIQTRVSGGDYHMVITFDDGAVGEVAHVDGVGYYREHPGDWMLQQGQATYSLVISPEFVCPNIEDTATRIGEEIIGSIPTTRFSDDGPKIYYLPGTFDDPTQPKMSIKRDLWIDAKGQLVQFKQVFDTPAGDWYPAHQRIEFTSKVSDVGEPNVIEVP